MRVQSWRQGRIPKPKFTQADRLSLAIPRLDGSRVAHCGCHIGGHPPSVKLRQDTSAVAAGYGGKGTSPTVGTVAGPSSVGLAVPGHERLRDLQS